MDAAVATPDKIRILDLADPVLSPLQQQALTSAAQHPVRIDEEAILSAACERTRLIDFGADDFRARLRAWAYALNQDKGLSDAGRFTAWSEMVRFASTRLQVEDCVRRNPAILEIPIETSVVVAGLPRSGTTYLLQLLAGDRRLRSMPQWETVRPVAEPYMNGGVDTRRDLSAAEWAQLDATMPYLKMIHEFSPDYIAEDHDLQCLDFGSYCVEWLAEAPSWRDYYFSHDQTPVYHYLRRVLQVMSWHRGPLNWVTKCPIHMEQLLTVKTALPGSTIAINHRDPVASIQSFITGLAYSSRMMRKQVDPRRIADYWIDRYERLLRACVRDRDQLDSALSHDVYFHDLMADPMGIIETIYAKAGLNFDAQAQSDIRQAMSTNTRGKHGQLVYDLREDFGLDPEAIRGRFSFYYDRFPVKIEVG